MPGQTSGTIGMAARLSPKTVNLDEGGLMKTMTCYGCKGKGHVSGEVCHICGGSGKIPVPAEPAPPEIEEEPEKE